MAKKKRIDRETQVILDRGQNLQGLLEHPGWAIYKENLLQRVQMLESIQNLNLQDPTVLVQELYGRQIAANFLRESLNQVENEVGAFKTNVGKTDKEVEDYVSRF